MSDESSKPKLPSDEDIAARFERIREELKGMDLPDLPDEQLERLQARPAIPEIDHAAVESRLANIESRVRKAKGQYVTAVNKPSARDIAQTGENSQGMRLSMTLVSLIVGLPTIGTGLGWAIDLAVHTTFCKGIGFVAGGVWGVYLSIHMVNDSAKKAP